MRAAVERLLGDPELRERLGRAARARAGERFGWDGVIEQTLGVYRDALASGR
jgi:glycosyltransferase involved in cell wall biosynthesis